MAGRRLLSRMSSSSLNPDNDGFLDTLRLAGNASVTTAGEYQIAGTLYAPNGSVLQQINQTMTLNGGRITIDLDSTTGSGVYQVRGLTLTSLSDTTQRASSGTVFIGPLDGSAWIGTSANAPTLVRLWEQAQTAGAIHRYGLYVSEHNRLKRIPTAAESGDTATEKTQLDTFMADVTGAGATIDQGWRTRIGSYATAIRHALG